MLPRWHILFGAIFTIIIYLVAPWINFYYLFLIFFASFLIDFDHYVYAVQKTKKLSLKNSLEYYKKRRLDEKKDISHGIKRKGDFHFFHTVEFHFLIGMFTLISPMFFYLFLGMVFHSLLDVIDMLLRGAFHRREFFFFNWLRKKL